MLFLVIILIHVDLKLPLLPSILLLVYKEALLMYILLSGCIIVVYSGLIGCLTLSLEIVMVQLVFIFPVAETAK